METHSYDILKYPRQKSSRRFLSAGQINRRFGISYERILELSEHYGWSTRRDSTTGWKDWYREDQIERTMRQIGATEIGK